MVKVWTNDIYRGTSSLEETARTFVMWMDNHFEYGESSQKCDGATVLYTSPNGDKLKFEFDSVEERIEAVGEDSDCYEDDDG